MLGLIFGHLLVGIAHAQIVRRGRLWSRSGIAALDPETLPVLARAFRLVAMHRVRAGAARHRVALTLLGDIPLGDLVGIDVALVDAHRRLRGGPAMPGQRDARNVCSLLSAETA